MTETSFLRKVWAELSAKGIKLFRNNCGTAWQIYQGKKTPINFGLTPGSGDLIGWTTIVITPDMVGQKIAVFTSIEVKTKTGKVRPEQEHWDKIVREAGGISNIVREG